MINVVFMGSDIISCDFLDALLTAGDIDVRGIVTKPDKMSGRGTSKSAAPPPGYVHKWVAEQEGLGRKGLLDRLIIPAEIEPGRHRSINSPGEVARIRALKPDFIVVVAFGQFLREELLALPPFGCVNMHLSLLPKLRGAAPIPRSILGGYAKTGVTAMHMDIGMDTGPILGFRETPLAPDDTRASVTERLLALGPPLMLETLRRRFAGDFSETPQDESEATLAPKVSRADWTLDWTRPAEDVVRTVRAFSARPGALTYVAGKPSAGGTPQRSILKVYGARAEDVPPEAREIAAQGVPGTVLVARRGLLVLAGDGRAVRLTRVQPAGRKDTLDGAAFANGFRGVPGQRCFLNDDPPA